MPAYTNIWYLAPAFIPPCLQSRSARAAAATGTRAAQGSRNMSGHGSPEEVFASKVGGVWAYMYLRPVARCSYLACVIW